MQELLDDHHHDRGDLLTWNDWVYRFPQLFNLVSPHNCLVLRPDGSGARSKLHIPELAYKNNILYYQNQEVMALHFTKSKGTKKTWKDYEPLLTNPHSGRTQQLGHDKSLKLQYSKSLTSDF